MKTYGEIISNFKLQESKEILNTVSENFFSDLSNEVVRNIIAQHSEKKITSDLLEHHIKDSCSKRFSLEKSLVELRKLNKFDDNIFNDLMEFILEDNSKVLISFSKIEQLQEYVFSIAGMERFIGSSKENLEKILALLV